MDKVTVTQKEESSSGWQFDVIVSDDTETHHQVTLASDYWQKLTNKEVTPEELVKKSFIFLLARESKESILRRFDLPLIQTYFPEYESEIKKSGLVRPQRTF